MAIGDTIIQYSNEVIRDFMGVLNDAYLSSQTKPISFEDWKAIAFPILYKSGKQFHVEKPDFDKSIRVAPDATDMLKLCKDHSSEFEDIQLNASPERKDFLITELCKELFKPAYVINREKIDTVRGVLEGKEVDVPVWFNSTKCGIALRFGFDDGDSSKPSCIFLGDDNVHMMLGGRTGSGKSVALNTAICNLLLEYPPWELKLYLADFKIVELSRYASRFKVPHIKMLAATKSTEFVLSTYEELKIENDARMSLFALAGVQNIKDFRDKFDLVMPRVLQITDEFTQMYENIKDSREAGNDHADEDKNRINSSISSLARQSRSQGIHMLESSQNLSELEDNVSKQFAVGMSLRADDAVSNMLIGNSGASKIKGKGKGYYNMNKSAKDIRDNVLVRIPFLKSEQSDKDSAEGKLTNLDAILKDISDLSNKYAYKSDLAYFNETLPVPYDKFVEGKKYCKCMMENPKIEDPIEKRIFKEVTSSVLLLGPEVRYTKVPCAYIQLKVAKNENILVAAKDPKVRDYMISVLISDFSQYDYDHIVIDADRAITVGCDIENKLNCTVLSELDVPATVRDRYRNRSYLVSVQNMFDSRNSGEFDDKLLYDKVIVESGWKYAYTQLKPLRLFEILKEIENSKIISSNENMAEEFSISAEDVGTASAIIERFLMVKRQYLSMISKGKINGKSFRKQVVWIFGLDNFMYLDTDDSGDYCTRLRRLLSDATRYNIFFVVVSTRWDRTREIPLSCNHVLEKCGKDFFSDIQLPKNINIYENTFQYHNRETRNNKICSLYSKLENI